jgi:ornithine decarboxylase
MRSSCANKNKNINGPTTTVSAESSSSSSSTINKSSATTSHEVLPSSVHGLVECARHEIRSLLQEVIVSSSSYPKDNHANDNHANANANAHANSSNDDSVEDALDDGFMICDLQVIQNKLDAWLGLFSRVKPYFALKCNPDVQVAQVLGSNTGQAGFDCASLSELRLAQDVTDTTTTTDTATATATRGKSLLGVEHVVYANPQRAEQDLQVALDEEMGVRALTFDGAEELHKIHAAWQALKLKQLVDSDSAASSSSTTSTSTSTTPLQLILRILVPDLHSSVPLGEKFGAPLTHIQELAELAQELNLQIIGISFHCGSGCHDPDAYSQALRLARHAMDQVDQVQSSTMTTKTTSSSFPKCWLLDMGGGYPGWDGAGGDVGRFSGRSSSSSSTSLSRTNHHGNPEEIQESAADIAKVVVPILDNLFPSDQYTRISEPGRYFVEAAFMLASRIYKVRTDEKTGLCHYTIGHGVQGVFKDVVLCGESFVPIPLRHSMVLEEEKKDAVQEEANNTTQQQQQQLKSSVVRGPSGEDYDIVCGDCQLPELQVGDWLLFDRMGAYTLSIASRTGRPIIRYVKGGGPKK